MEEIWCRVVSKKISKGPCLYTKGQIRDTKLACSECSRYQELQELGFDPVKGFPTKELMGFTRYPPDAFIPIEELPKHQLLVAETEIDTKTFISLLNAENRFKEKKDPLAALDAFVIYHEAELYPPIWAISWLVEGLKKYHSSNGKKDLEQLLGFKKGKGQENLFKRACEEERDEALMFDVFRLHKFCGYSVKESTQMVSARLKKTPDWNKTGLKLRTLTAGTLEKEYSKKWRSIFEKFSEETIEKMAKEFNHKKKSYLKLFPRSSKRK